MQLTDFIHRDMEAILAEWEKFASAQLPAAAHMSSLALRDHAEHVLRAVAKDIATAQTLEEQADKSDKKKISGLRPEFHYNIQIHLPGNGTEETYLNIFNALRRTFS